MNAKTFDDTVQRQVQHSLDLLCAKGTEYAPGVDRLAAFKKAAALQGCTQEQAAFGMLAKHLVSIADMVQTDSRFSGERWDEKIGDSINYLLILRAIVEEGEKHEEYQGRHLES